MADEDQGTPYTPSIPQDGVLAPVLDNLRQQVQPNEDGSTWADSAISDIQQHANRNAVVDANQAVGNRFVQNMGEVKDNLVGMVHDDPTSASLALSLAPKLVAPLIHASGMGDDDADAAHADITGHIQNAIANTAVTRMADLHADGARQLMGSLGDHLSDDEQSTLGNYIDTMQAARTADNAAGVQQMVKGQQQRSGVAAYQFGSSLLDPRTEAPTFPPDYLQTLVRNKDILPEDKQPLFTAYSRLQTPGDVNASNPYAVRQLLSDIADPNVPIGHGDIMDHVGADVRYADAVMLHGMNLQRTPDGMGAVEQLGGLLDQAKAQIAPESSRAGDAAYGRFVNWLLPSYRRTGPAGLNPNADNYLFNGMSLDSFRPTHEDAVRPIGYMMGAEPGSQTLYPAPQSEQPPGADDAGGVTRDMRIHATGDTELLRSVPPGTGDQLPTATGNMSDRQENYDFRDEDRGASLRPSLGEIFAGNSPELDEKMRRLEQLRNENTQPIAPASGNFYQRLLPQPRPVGNG